MVVPKTNGSDRRIPAKPASARRQDIQLMVPKSHLVRTVEAFDATPASGVSEIITAENSSFNFLRLTRIKLTPAVIARES